MTPLAILAWSSLVGAVPANTRLASLRKIAAIFVVGTWTVGTAAGAGGGEAGTEGAALACASAMDFNDAVCVGDSFWTPALAVPGVKWDGSNPSGGSLTLCSAPLPLTMGEVVPVRTGEPLAKFRVNSSFGLREIYASLGFNSNAGLLCKLKLRPAAAPFSGFLGT